jgi:ribulose-phosphate 3-epimerase
MRASVSLWSADQLALGAAVDVLDGQVDGFHVDVMDGHFGPDLLFGPATVAALAGRARRSPVDVHLVVDDADRWVGPFAEAGAGMLTVHPECCADVAATVAEIAARGVRAGVALSLDAGVETVAPLLGAVDRVLVMGTAIGIKGADPAPETVARVRDVAALRVAGRPEVFVDGGIRAHTIGAFAAAGADGVVPGSLVFDRADWLEGVRLIAAAG